MAISDIIKKIERERILINGARSMYSQTDNPSVQNRLRSSIHEYERNISYLSERLKELELKARNDLSSSQASAAAQRASIGGTIPPVPPPKDGRNGPQENGRGQSQSGQRAWQQAGPNKSRQYTKLGMSRPVIFS